jgi:diphosphomevalonate decarboxylase
LDAELTSRSASSRSATTIAHPNIALAKYWGKRAGNGNYPAAPSLSVTLAGLATRTTVSFDETLTEDELTLDGVRASGAALTRASALLTRVRAASSQKSFARVTSANDFPTSSGLASSASGFAALALGAVRAAGLDWSTELVSDLARRASASAARSLFGGFVELDAGPVAPIGHELLAARQVAVPHHLDLAVLVCVTTDDAKSVSSTSGMLVTQRRSPYYKAWLEDASLLHNGIREALARRDFHALGELSEASALAMHACAMAAGVVYVNGATLDVLAQVRALRARGLGVYATMDAGPHVKVLVDGFEAERAMNELRSIPSVLRVLDARPGDGARTVTQAAR